MRYDERYQEHNQLPKMLSYVLAMLSWILLAMLLLNGENKTDAMRKELYTMQTYL